MSLSAPAHASEQLGFLSTILNNSPTPTLAFDPVVDEQGQIVDFQASYANRAAETLTRLSFEVMQTTTLLPVYASAKTSGLFDQLVNVVHSGQSFTKEIYVDSLGIWVDASVTPLGDGFMATLIDISRHKAAMQQAEAQNRLLQGILDTSLNGTIVYEAIRDEQHRIRDFRFRLFNQMAREDILSRIGRDIASHTLLSIYPDSHESGLFALYARVTETGQIIRTEHHYTDIDTWYDVSLTKLDDGCVVTFINISAAKRTARRVEDQNALLQGIMNVSPNGLVACHAVRNPVSQAITDFTPVLTNRSAEVFIHPADGESISRRLMVLPIQGQNQPLLACCADTVETGLPFRTETVFRENGVETWLDVSAAKLGDGVVLSVMDSTERKKAQRQTENLVEELRKSNANLEQFAYIASHDLQEPLRKISAFGDMLNSQYAGPLGETGTGIIHRMQSAALRMQALIRDLLAYSQVAGNNNAFGPINLTDVVSEVMTDLETALQANKAVVTVEPLPTINGDPMQWRQLFQNLLSNALKFTLPNRPPVIHISGKMVAGPDVPAGMPGAACYRLAVSDNGIGFEQHYADRIFQLFQRLHTRSMYAGTGIGLSIVQKVVENHNGLIQAIGKSGEGATFIVFLPMETE